MRVLTVNTGSSSVKLRVVDSGDAVVASRDTTPQLVESAVRDLLDECPADAVGHRVVHGGARHVVPTVVDDTLVADLAQLVDLAPLHQPLALDAIAAAQRAAPDLPAVACFDTAFHSRIPAEARTYAVPTEWRERFGLRRYGFHGLSYAWAARRVPQLLGGGVRRQVVAHLGSGASVAAVLGDHSIDTSMGFTPMEGLVMATRSGSVDPGMLLWLVERAGVAPLELTEGLDRRGGLLALAGTRDMREVVDRAERGDDAASLALSVYVYRLAAELAAMVAALGGLDALVFTGGVGERSAAVRRLAVDRLAFLGLRVDEQRNASVESDASIEAPGSAAPVLVVHSREDAEIARGVREALAAPPD
jgi:acetate kinase